MESSVFERIIDSINKHRNGCKNDIFERLTKIDKLDLKLETFTSIYANLKRRQVFRSNDPKSLNWRRLKEQSINLALKYAEYEQEENNQQPPSNLIIKMANELMTSPVLIDSYGFLRDVDKMACNFNAGTNKRVIYVCDKFPDNYITMDLTSLDEELI